MNKADPISDKIPPPLPLSRFLLPTPPSLDRSINRGRHYDLSLSLGLGSRLPLLNHRLEIDLLARLCEMIVHSGRLGREPLFEAGVSRKGDDLIRPSKEGGGEGREDGGKRR
jgi:hypothetical protein